MKYNKKGGCINKYFIYLFIQKFMDSITKKFLEEFCNSFELNKNKESIAFEHFCNYCCVNKENGIVDIKLNDLSTGSNACGIDGIAIIVNNKLVTSISEIQHQIDTNRSLDVNFVFIQAKTSSTFNNGQILNFFEFTKSFFENNVQNFDTPEMKNFYEMKNFIYDKAELMITSNPKLSMYYVTTGKWTNSKTLLEVINRNKKELNNLNIFSSKGIKFFPCGADEIQEMYRKTINNLTTTFKFEKYILMFSDEDGTIGYSGIIPFKEYRKIIMDDDGDTLRPVFNDNIRDFLGNNPVNTEIINTLQNLNINSFCMLNNGITIIADKIQITGPKTTLTDYQIVNGCQTTHILYENKDLHGIDELLIPIKIIATKDDETRGKITKATNSQTSIKPEQLEALSDFQKKLEIFYTTFNEGKKLYYERRTGQYRLEAIPKTKIVNISQQIKSVSAMFLNNPHGVSGNYGTIIKDIVDKIFKKNDKEIIYYTSSFAQYKIEKLISDAVIDKKYNKARYHALMIFRIYISGKKVPPFNSEKIEEYCKKITDILFNDQKCSVIFSKIIDYIVAQKEINFNDRKTFERKETTDFLLKKSSQLKKFIEKSL